MRRIFSLAASLFVAVMLLCASAPAVNAGEVVPLSWTSPTGQHLHSVYMVSESDGWAVGGRGTIIHWDGTDWSNVTNPATHKLNSVFMVSANNGWIVGDYGAILQWDGSNWNTVASPTATHLQSVFWPTPNDGWAVGWNGAILQWDGVNWNNITGPTTEHLYSVFMVDPDNGWAVGAGGTIIRWNGASWNPVISPTTLTLFSVFMVGADDGWAVGYGGTIIRWNGTDWNLVWLIIDPPVTWFSSMFDDRVFPEIHLIHGWVVGSDGAIFQWDGNDWNKPTSPTANHLESVFMISPDDGWAVGWYGTIIRYVPPAWIPEFPTAMLMPLLISLTLIAATLTKIVPKWRRNQPTPSRT